MDLCPHGRRFARGPATLALEEPLPHGFEPARPHGRGVGREPPPPPGVEPGRPARRWSKGGGQEGQEGGVSFLDIMECLHSIMKRLDDLDQRIHALEQQGSAFSSGEWQKAEVPSTLE